MAGPVIRMGAKGRIVIPVELRQAAGLEEGDELTAHIDENGAVVIMSKERLIEALHTLFKDIPYSLADELIQERHAEAQREQEEL